MAKNNFTDEYLRKLAELDSERREAMSKLRIACNHNEGEPIVHINDYNGNKKLLDIPRNWIASREDAGIPTAVVVHPTCTTAFESVAFTNDEIAEALFILISSFHQVKLATPAMDDAKRASIDAMLADICTIKAEFFDEFYPGFREAMKKISSNKGGGRNNNSSRVGHRGLNYSRGY